MCGECGAQESVVSVCEALKRVSFLHLRLI